MTIEQRFKYAGLSFYLALAITLLSTDSGLKLIRGLQTRTDFYEVVVTVVGFGLVFFTSESIGYLLNAIFILYWNVRGGYSGEWRKLS